MKLEEVEGHFLGITLDVSYSVADLVSLQEIENAESIDELYDLAEQTIMESPGQYCDCGDITFTPFND